MASRQPVSRSNTSTSSTVRRNLFTQSHNRRPATASSAEALQLAEDNIDEEILIRDPDGKMQLIRPKPDEDEEDMVQEALIRNDKKYIELYRSSNRQGVELGDLRKAVQQSLSDKVASLDQDRWIYEREEDMDPRS